MYIPILIETLADGRFRARAGEPFALTAEGESCAAATQALERLIAERLANGAQVGMLYVPNGTPTTAVGLPADNRYLTDPSFAEFQAAIAENRRQEDATALHQTNLDFEPLPDDDWFFQGLREAIAEKRRLEDEADRGRFS